MKTYVNTSLIDAHNAQMQLEQMEGVRFQRAGTMEVYGKFLLTCAAGLALLMVGFGIMMWFMTPAPAPLADEYSTNYDISEVVIHNAEPSAPALQVTGSPGDAAESGGTAEISGGPSISDSLTQIQASLPEAGGDQAIGADAINQAVTDGVAAARAISQAKSNEGSDAEISSKLESDQTQGLPSDEFVVFRSQEVDGGAGEVVTGLKYRPEDLGKPYRQYCYWAESAGESTGTTTFELGEIDAETGLVWADNKMARRYKQHCQFLGA